MAIPPPPIPGPYPVSCTEASWKAAKTTGVRDRWNTELSAALRAAKTAYDRIDLQLIDLGIYRQHHGTGQTLAQLERLKVDAKQHTVALVKPAIKALEKAKGLAATAAINPVLTEQTRRKANAIAHDLGDRVAQLKRIHYADYDQSLTLSKGLLDHMFKVFDDDLSEKLRNGDQFVRNVRATPTPATFNAGIQTSARDITQLLGNVPKLQANGYRLAQVNPKHLVDLMEDWAQGTADVDANATAVQVRAEVKDFEKALKAVRDWRM